MTALRTITRRATVVAAALIVGLTAAYTPSHAAGDEARTTITDHPGAPGTMLRQFQDLTGRPVGDLDTVLAVDAGGRTLTADQMEALVAGEKVDGVEVVGAMPGGRDILGTTMADLADGRYDGIGGGETPTTSLIFASSVPGGRDWCLTMCVANGKSIWECLLSRRGADQILTLDLSGDTTVGGTKAAFEKANGVAVTGPDTVDTLIGDREPSADEIRTLLDGGDVESLRRVATVEAPDPDWALVDVAEKSGAPSAMMKAHIFTFGLPFIGKVLVVCISHNNGKTWKCSAQPWSGW
ncbi:hypothetical protein [Micromonospora humi]|uniref:Uncharacterized protein n=1 Tax=Micromonospora humi TaxID=745366 RepID=A0A1C5HTZ9_9ACTN|nr:hypothetical protein [Micromonospora humi]SCG49515.1 hypothetical protein GA0070213_10421 [Micromonospora humi]